MASGGVLWDSWSFLLLPCLYLIILLCTFQEESGKRAGILVKRLRKIRKRLRECVSSMHLPFSRGELTQNLSI